MGGRGENVAGAALREKGSMNPVFRDFRWRVALLMYRLLGPLLLALSLLPWLKKTIARGGWKSPLRERFGIYDGDAEWEPFQSIHLHAVSVGETLIALKILRAWKRSDAERVVLAVSTATAWQLATDAKLAGVRVVYAPIDWWPFVRAYLRRFCPKKVVLVEAEAWPELMQQCAYAAIPVSMVNARLSSRSERRFRKFGAIVRPMFAGLSKIGVQEKIDAERFIALGCSAESIVLTGSVKFDPGPEPQDQVREDFRKILNEMRAGKPIVLAASTHDGEELFIGEAVRQAGAFYLCVPRHAERRDEVRQSLMAQGWNVFQRSTAQAFGSPVDCYLIDTTGELREWTKLADLVVIGKSFLGEGGQNPCEAIMAHKCVITGPHMENFQPLVDDMIAAGGIVQVADAQALQARIFQLIHDEALRNSFVKVAWEILQRHLGATETTILELIA